MDRELAFVILILFFFLCFLFDGKKEDYHNSISDIFFSLKFKKNIKKKKKKKKDLSAPESLVHH